MRNYKMTKTGIVHIVHHVDTEGPLKESISEIWKRVENTLGIKMSKKWRTENSPEIVKEIEKLLDPHLLDLKGDWKSIEKMLKIIMAAKFRSSFKDSFGGGWIFNWHVMDHVGFKTNERGRDLGFLKVFNFYEEIIKKTGSKQDALQWHFHPISFFREAHISATSYENSYPEIHQILCRRLIEKNWFPQVNRAGFHTERPDSNWFLEQWIPFDPSNQSLDEEKKEIQKDAINGRYGDWKGAPSDWSIYHPDIYDWRQKGKSNRFIARILNLRARFRNISEKEIEKAFLKAKNGESVYLGVCNHDWRDMEPEINNFRGMLKKVSSKFPSVKYKFTESVEAFRAVAGYSKEEIQGNKLNFEVKIKGNALNVKIINGEIFGPQPYLAMKTKKGEYFHDNFDFGKFKKEYHYTFDRYTVSLGNLSKISIAANDKYGNCCIKNINLK